MDRVSMLGGEGDDALSLDATSGTPAPWKGLNFDGGAGGNSVGLLGTGGHDAISVAPGQIAATGSFGSEVVNNVGGISYTPDSGSHSLAVNGTVPLTIPRGTGIGIREIDLANLSGSKVMIEASSPTPGDYSLHGNRSVLVIASGGLQVATDGSGNPAGTLDLCDNDLVYRFAANLTAESAARSLIDGLLTSAFDGGLWDGAGLTSFAAASDASGTRAVGWGDNLDLGLSTFDGVDVSDQTEILVKFTYYGDATLDGQVTAPDNGQVAAGLSGDGTGWAFGDFDYSGGEPTAADNSLFAAGLAGYTQFGSL